MRYFLCAVVAALTASLPVRVFAAQFDGPRAMERVVQKNQEYAKKHSRQSNEAIGAPHAEHSSDGSSPDLGR
jgi:hypothetical protein